MTNALKGYGVVGQVEMIGQAGNHLGGEQVGQKKRRVVKDDHTDRALLSHPQIARVRLTTIVEASDFAFDPLPGRRTHKLLMTVENIRNRHGRNASGARDILDRGSRAFLDRHLSSFTFQTGENFGSISLFNVK